MISINASYTNLVNQRTLATNTNELQKATKRLATGMRVNHANDDAAAMFVGSALSSSLSGMKIALDNTMLASNFLNIADGALSNVSDNLLRMNQLATQACNGFMSTEARNTLQAELNQMKANITQTIGKADMNGVATVKKTGMSAGLMVEIDVKTEEKLKNEGYIECNEINLRNADNTLFYINSAEQLQALATFTNVESGDTSGRTFILSGDIDLSSVCSEESGISWAGIGYDADGVAFKGTFDGNGHVISNLYINKPTKNDYGLFSHLQGATIRNLGIERVNITAGTNNGGLAGNIRNSTISNVYATGKIVARGGQVGGIAGSLRENSSLENSYSSCEISSQTPHAGGLIGQCVSSQVSNVFATGNVSGKSNDIGGLIGYLKEGSTLQNAYATGNVKSEESIYIGGLIGGIAGTSTVNNVYATGDVNGHNSTGGLIGNVHENSSVSNAFSTGSVEGDASNIGLIIGSLANSISGSNLYYSTDATLNKRTSNKVIGSGAANCTPAPTGASLANLKSTIDWNSWDTDIWDLSGDLPTFKKRSTATPVDNNIAFQISDGYDENSSIEFDCALNLNLGNLDLSNEKNARHTLNKIQELLTQVTQKRSYIGTQLNRLSGIATASQMTIENYSAAKSTIFDTDIAQEVANMTRAQILQQISVSVLSQSKNIDGQIVLSLIR